MFFIRRPMMGRTAGGGSPLTFTFRASAVSNAATITIPGGVQDNDFGILIDIADNVGTTPTAVTPTNWTNRYNQADSGLFSRTMVSSKVLTAAEASSSITGMDDSTEDKVMLVFTPSRAIVTATFSSLTYQGTASNPTAQTVSALGQPSPLIVIGGSDISGGTAAFTTASPAFDATVATADADLIVGYKMYDSSPQNHTIDMGDLGSHNILLSFFMRFT